MNNLPLIVSIASLIVSPTIAIIFALYMRRSGNSKAEMEKLAKAIADLSAVVAELATKEKTRTPYFDELQRSLATGQHCPSPEHAQKDRLLEELQALTLTDERRVLLESILQAEIDNPEVQQALALKVVSHDEKLRIQAEVDDARLLLATMPKVLAARKALERQAEVEAKSNLQGNEPPEDAK